MEKKKKEEKGTCWNWKLQTLEFEIQNLQLNSLVVVIFQKFETRNFELNSLVVVIFQKS